MFEGYKKVNKKHYAWLIILLSPVYYFCMMLSAIFGIASDLLEIVCHKIDDLTKR
jgi:hypothetical protein